MEYTKGEWKIKEDNDIYVENTCIVQVYGNSCDEAAANAHLISAAPDMYEALKEARVTLAVLQPNGSAVLREIDKALAKAEGRTQ